MASHAAPLFADTLSPFVIHFRYFGTIPRVGRDRHAMIEDRVYIRRVTGDHIDSYRVDALVPAEA